jgi:hypothetical protein
MRLYRGTFPLLFSLTTACHTHTLGDEVFRFWKSLPQLNDEKAAIVTTNKGNLVLETETGDFINIPLSALSDADLMFVDKAIGMTQEADPERPDATQSANREISLTPTDASREIKGPAVLSRNGQTLSGTVTSVRGGLVKARGFTPLHFRNGEVETIWLLKPELIPGIHDAVPQKYEYNDAVGFFTKVERVTGVSISDWTVAQGHYVEKGKRIPNPRATASALIENNMAAAVAVHIILHLSGQSTSGTTSGSVLLDPGEAKTLKVDFGTGSKWVETVTIFDYEVNIQ